MHASTTSTAAVTATIAHPRAWPWLLAGGLLLFASQLTGGIGLLAWIAPVPLLRYLRLTRGWRARAGFGAALALAWVAATAKIVSAPLPAVFALCGVGLALGPTLGFLVWDRLRDRVAPAARIWIWPAAMVLVDVASSRWSPLGVWGATANTQLDDLPLLQLASLGGVALIGLIVHVTAAALEELLAARLDRIAPPPRGALVAIAALVVAVHAWGTWRLARPLGATVTVAAVDTAARFTGPEDLPDDAARAATLATLLDDTARAARAGARLVVWTEGATSVEPGHEAALLAAVEAVARREHVDVVITWVVLVATDPTHYRNEYTWITAAGAVDHTWRKHHPAPGEPAIAGDEPPVAVDGAWGRASGAICYDYDFPTMAAAHGALGVDLIALPSSDWRGIDPIHTRMAALRAIEQGFSVLRATRFGLSAGIDPHGQLRASRSSFDGGDRVMLVALPVRGAATLYRLTGDLPLVLLACALLALAARPRRR